MRRWRAHRRDDAGDHAGTGVCAAHVSSSGRQKRIEVRAMGWSLEGRRLATANNEGSVATWSGLDFSHLNTTQLHTDRDTGSGVPIHALAWLRDGASFVTGDAQVIITNIETPRFWIDPLRNWAAWARCILMRPTRGARYFAPGHAALHRVGRRAAGHQGLVPGARLGDRRARRCANHGNATPYTHAPTRASSDGS